MTRNLSLVAIFTSLLTMTCFVPAPLGAHAYSAQAVEAVHPTQFSLDSPLLRITTVFGVGRDTYIKDTQPPEMMAIPSNALEDSDMGQSALALEKMRPYPNDLARDTGRQFESVQNKYMKFARTSPQLQQVAAEDLPESLNNTQQVTFQNLALSQHIAASARYRGRGACVPKKCAEDDKECKVPVCDENDATCKQQEDSCTSDCSDTCQTDCTDYCDTEDTGLIASGAYGGGGGGGGGYSGFGGGGGGGFGGGGNTPPHHDVPVPEPSTYIILGSLICFVGFLRHRRGVYSSSRKR